MFIFAENRPHHVDKRVAHTHPKNRRRSFANIFGMVIFYGYRMKI